MAVLRVERFEDFKVAAESNTNQNSHIAVTDEATYVWLVPTVTSQHRHYIYLEGEGEVTKALEWLKGRGYKIVRGSVELRTT